MPLTTADYIQQHRIASTSLQKSGDVPSRNLPVRAKGRFSAVLDNVQGTCRGVSTMGKKCLTTVNPVHHIAALYRIAQAGMHPAIDSNEKLSDSLTVPDISNTPVAPLLDVVDEGGPDATVSGHSFNRLGAVSEKYESGTQGIAAIGYDRNGGTSYGTYQLSSRAGTMSRFIDYLREHAPRWAERLSASGPANTGGARGRMPREWKKIAAENPERLAQLEYDFIRKTHYEEALAQVRQKTGIDMSQRSVALQEALWSTAVQHGPRGAADIVGRALKRIGADNRAFSDERLIHEIYANRSRCFTSSARRVRASVQNRFSEEKQVLLALLRSERGARNA